MKIILVALFLFDVLFAQNLRVATAANMSETIKALVRDYKHVHPEVQISINIASSGKLASQILHHAPYDIFLSANTKYPNNLYKAGVSSKPVVYAKGALILLSAHERDFSNPTQLLLSSKIHKIALANPRTAPYGKAAQEYLYSLHLYKQLHNKFVFGESIGQTLTYTLKAADIGVVAKSALYAPHMEKFRNAKHWIDVPKNSYTPIEQAMVRISNTQTAKDFFSYLQSERAQRIITQYGYQIP